VGACRGLGSERGVDRVAADIEGACISSTGILLRKLLAPSLLQLSMTWFGSMPQSGQLGWVLLHQVVTQLSLNS
jgi:hypothetical protein